MNEKELRDHAGVIQTEIDGIEMRASDDDRELTDDEIGQLNKLYDKQDYYIRKLGEDPGNFRAGMAGMGRQVKVPAGIPNGLLSVRDTSMNLSSRYGSLGEVFQAMAASSIPQGESKYGAIGRFRVGEIDRGLMDLRTSDTPQMATGANVTVPSEGGFLTGTEMSNELLKGAFETGFLASRVRRRVLSGPNNSIKWNAYDETSRADGSRYGGIRTYWKAEAAALAGSKPKYRQVELEMKKLTGLYYATDELIQDSAALEAEIRAAFNAEFGFQIDRNIILGDGAGKPLGFKNSPALVTQDAEGSQAADTVITENVLKMYARFHGNRGNGVWITNRDCFPELAKLNMPIGTGGTAVGLLKDIAGEPYSRMLSMPILEMEQAETLGDLGDIYLIDPQQYVWADKGGIQGAVSIHVKFVEDEVVFRFIYRCDGSPIPAAAITPFKGASTISPFITLAARA